MKTFAKFVLAFPLLTLAACGQPTETKSESAEDYAARIANGGNGGGASPSADTTIAPMSGPAPAAVTGPVAPEPVVDPQAFGCGANAARAFLGRMADDATRAEVMETIGTGNIRFLEPGSAVQPNANSPRLNIMLDAGGIIRDARCG